LLDVMPDLGLLAAGAIGLVLLASAGPSPRTHAA
jgi:hypothetical protein